MLAKLLDDGKVLIELDPAHPKYAGVVAHLQPDRYERAAVLRYARVHSPVGGVTLGGTFYPGGQWIPVEAVRAATEQERVPLFDDSKYLSREHKSSYPGADPNDPEKIVLHLPDKDGKKEIKIQGQDKDFADAYLGYVSKHLDKDRDSIDETWGDDDLSDEQKEEIVEEARERIESHVTHFADAVIDHLKKTYGDEIEYQGEDEFRENMWQATAAIDEAVEDQDVDALYEAVSELQSVMEDATSEFVSNTESTWDDYQYEVEKEIEAEKDEIADEHFEDLQNEVNGQLDDDSTQDDIDRAWTDTIRSYNAMIAKNDKEEGNNYRISLDENGRLEVVDADDLPDEFKPEPEPPPDTPQQGRLFNRRGIPLRYDLRQAIKDAAASVARNPTEEQIAAGNYRKGHCTIQGLDITIENPAGSTRSGTDKDGKPWSVKMRNHYGYIKKTKSEADGDHCDIFLGPEPESEIVFVVDQVDADGHFDEHKILIAFTNHVEAKAAYLANYSPGWYGFGAMTPMLMDDFKAWLQDGDTSRAIAE